MTTRRQRIATGVRVAGPEILSFSEEDQQVILRKVAQDFRMEVNGHRDNWMKAVEWSERFQEDYTKASNKVLELWEKAGFPFPVITGFEVLSDGTPYQSDGEAFMEFTKSVWYDPEDNHRGIEDDY